MNTRPGRIKPKALVLSKPADLMRLRRHALAAQGLLRHAPFGRGRNGAGAAIAHLGYVQIDTIAVIERAHHHVLATRVPGFTPAMTHELLTRRDIFEYWTHAAAFLPMRDFRYSLPYKALMRGGHGHWIRSRDRALMQRLLDQVRSDGALRSRDVGTRSQRSTGWWDWKPAKQALEQLFMEGQLLVSARHGMEKVYDLPERVLPSWVDTRPPSPQECAQHLLQQQLRCHAFVSRSGATYSRRNPALREAMAELLTQQVVRGDLEVVTLADGDQYFCLPGLLDQRLPPPGSRLHILSPFDNAVIQRERLKRVFAFDYQLECYIPATKRRYGYFCLPLLFRDGFVGSLDCKADRPSRTLQIRALHLQETARADEALRRALVHSLRAFAIFQDCDNIKPSTNLPQRWRTYLGGNID